MVLTQLEDQEGNVPKDLTRDLSATSIVFILNILQQDPHPLKDNVHVAISSCQLSFMFYSLEMNAIYGHSNGLSSVSG